MKLNRKVYGAFLALACLSFCAASVRAQAVPVTVTKIGSPVWSLVDFNFAAADVGTGADGYAEFFSLTGEKILPPPFYKNYPGVGAGPGDPHAPPYDKDLSNGFAALGLTQQTVFPIKDFTNGRAPLFAFMIVADGTDQGSSPDFANGPIIPNALSPINVSLADKKDGADFSAPGSFPIPSTSTLDPKFANLDGSSHVPFFVFDNADFANDPKAPLAGSYQFEVKLLDTAGNGWNVVAPFTVTGSSTAIPLPAAVIPGIALLAGMPIARKLRRR